MPRHARVRQDGREQERSARRRRAASAGVAGDLRPITTAVLLAITACAGHALPPSKPDYQPIAGIPAPPQATLYANCLADATATGHYRYAHDATTHLILFTCTGVPATTFFDGLADYSAHIGSQFQHAGRTYRSTTRVRQNLFGVDYCATDGTTYECMITLNVGAFVQ
jgi:hypothetical protein